MGWAAAGGVAIGFAAGSLVARLVLYLRRPLGEAVGLDNFLALGLVALSYGAAVLVHAYGFLAVFAAGLALRRVETRAVGEEPAKVGPSEDAVHPERAPGYMAEAVLGFNEQIEKLLEVAAVVVLGALLATARPSWPAAGLTAFLFLAARPAAVFLGLVGSPTADVRRWLIAWFGVRGVGSLYYPAYATGHGVPPELARTLSDLVVTTVAASVVVHGVSVTPAMEWYGARRARQRESSAGPAPPARAE